MPYKGSAASVLHQLVGGLRAAMGYTGNATMLKCSKNVSSGAQQKPVGEKHVHDVTTREAPNYRKDG